MREREDPVLSNSVARGGGPRPPPHVLPVVDMRFAPIGPYKAVRISTLENLDRQELRLTPRGTRMEQLIVPTRIALQPPEVLSIKLQAIFQRF